MDKFLNNNVTWTDFFVTAVLLIAAYFLLKMLQRLIIGLRLPYRFERPAEQTVHYTLLVYEPLVVLILTVTFVLVNPVFHGLLVGLLIVLGFRQLRNYATGRLLQLGGQLSSGTKVTIGDRTGILFRAERFGVRLQTSKGIHYISYQQLLDRGYMIASGENVGGFYRLKVMPQAEHQKLSEQSVIDLLATAPYLNWNHQPESILSEKKPNQVNVRVSVREERHLQQLIHLIESNGYQVRTAKN